LKTFITIGVSAGAVGAMVAGGLTVSSFLSGGGTQPEDVLPANALGFVKVDLNPSAGQKLNALRLMRKFPEIKDHGDDLKATLVESLLEDADLGLTYKADIEPWLGDRAAIAFVPSDTNDEGVAPLIALEFTDEAAMVAALDKAEKQLRTEHEELYADFEYRGSSSSEREGSAFPSEVSASAEPVPESFTEVEPSAVPEDYTVVEPGTSEGGVEVVVPGKVTAPNGSAEQPDTLTPNDYATMEPGTAPDDFSAVEPNAVEPNAVELNTDPKSFTTPEPGTAPESFYSGEEGAEDISGVSPSPSGKVMTEPEAEDFDPFDYAVRDNFVILSEHQSDVDAAAGAAQVLSGHASFAADKAAIDGTDQIVLGWVNIGAVYDIVPEDEKAEFAETFGSARPAGRVVVGVHAEPDAVEAVGRTIDLEAAGAEALATGGAGSGLVKDLPADTSVAFSGTGLGDLAVDLWDRYGSEPFLDVTDEAKEMGVTLPDDLVAVLGQEAAAGVVIGDEDGFDFSATARVRTEDADRALEVIELLGESPTEDFEAVPAPDGYVASTDPEHLADAANGDMSLGENEVFANAVPDADDASVVLFVDIPDVIRGLDAAFGGSDESGEAEEEPIPWGAFGATATGDAGNGEFKLRLTFR
jgi:hypothetical protein